MIALVYAGTVLLVFLMLELSLQVVVNYLRKDFQWLINKHDEYPYFNPEALKKFFNNSFDKELGWVRKAGSSGIEHGEFGDVKYHIDKHNNYVQHHPGFLKDDKFPDGLCRPCCFKAWDSKSQIERREECMSKDEKSDRPKQPQHLRPLEFVIPQSYP